MSKKSCVSLIEKFNKKTSEYERKILNFSGVGCKDVYNISHPFEVDGKTIIAGRVEKRQDWAKSKVVFFEQKGTTWKAMNNAPVFDLEDAFVTKINDEIIFGGVEVYTLNNKFHSKDIQYKTVFFKGKNLSLLEKFACGPERMKDIRLKNLTEEKIGIFTRPQGGKHGRGQMGYIETNHVKEINEEKCLKAKIIKNLFVENEWGGANELHLLKNGDIGVLGHIAYEDEKHFKHYYAMTFTYNPQTHKASPIKILATRQNFPRGETKRPELEDVVFPGGLIRHGDGSATLYAGLSDAQAGYVTLPDPFGDF